MHGKSDKADIYGEAFNTLQRAEDEICERTLKRLEEHAAGMGITLDKALEDVTPDTRERLKKYLVRQSKSFGWIRRT